MDFVKRYYDVPIQEIEQAPLKSKNLQELGYSKWDVDFLDIEMQLLLELMNAANFLGLESLVRFTCVKCNFKTKKNCN
jgi:hypothetical protein